MKPLNHTRYLLFSAVAFILALLLPAMSFAQDSAGAQVDMADAMRQSGKIYVVILVIGIVFTGLVIYAFRTDRKVSRLEREIKNLKSSRES